MVSFSSITKSLSELLEAVLYLESMNILLIYEFPNIILNEKISAIIMFSFKSKQVTRPMRQQMKNKGKAKFSESLNNYNALREVVENQLRRRVEAVAPKRARRFQIA